MFLPERLLRRFLIIPEPLVVCGGPCRCVQSERLETAGRSVSISVRPPPGAGRRLRATAPAVACLLAAVLARCAALPLVQPEGSQIGARQVARQPLYVELVLAPLHTRRPDDVLQTPEHDISRHRQVEPESRIGLGTPLLEQVDEL